MASKNIGAASIQQADVAAATTTDVLAPTNRKIRITGSGATITSLGSTINREKQVLMASSNTLVHHATTMILPGGVNIPTAAGDTFEVNSDSAGNARVSDYMRADGKSLIGPAAADITNATAAGRTLLTDASAAAQRTSLGLGTAATQNTGTSGAVIPTLNAACVVTGGWIFDSVLGVAAANVASFVNATSDGAANVSNIGGAGVSKLGIASPLEWAPAASETPSANGRLSFEATSNTTLTIKFKGSDGVTRSVGLTLS